MKIYAPNYYKDFKCIAGACNHSCCMGWEIDIDSKTYDTYNNYTGDFGKRLRSNIVVDGVPQFKLSENERCPFLNDNNLCDIILELGEENLCQICTDHPRFKNFMTNRTEIGLGLCCEAAAELILNHREKTEIIEISDDCTICELTSEEHEFLNIRDEIFKTIQDRELPFSLRVKKLKSHTGIIIPENSASAWAKILLELEQLDGQWTTFLNSIANEAYDLQHIAHTVSDTCLEQLLFYLIYRHLRPDDINYSLRFSLICFEIIEKLSFYYDFKEICRMFSCEIEYSEENTKFLENY